MQRNTVEKRRSETGKHKDKKWNKRQKLKNKSKPEAETNEKSESGNKKRKLKLKKKVKQEIIEKKSEIGDEN